MPALLSRGRMGRHSQVIIAGIRQAIVMGYSEGSKGFVRAADSDEVGGISWRGSDRLLPSLVVAMIAFRRMRRDSLKVVMLRCQSSEDSKGRK